MRGIGQQLKSYGSAALDAIRLYINPDREAERLSERAGRAARDSDRSLEQADRVNRKVDQQREHIHRENGRDEKVADHDSQDEWVQELLDRMQRQRGDRES